MKKIKKKAHESRKKRAKMKKTRKKAHKSREKRGKNEENKRKSPQEPGEEGQKRRKQGKKPTHNEKSRKVEKSSMQKNDVTLPFFSRLLFLADYANLIYIDCIEICNMSNNSQE